MHSRLRKVFESIVLFNLRQVFVFIYPLFRNNSSVIKTTFFESHMIAEIKKSISSPAVLFDGKHKLPINYGRGLNERCVEIPWVMNRLSDRKTFLLDAGSSLNFPEILFSKKMQQKEIVISNLNPERNCYWTKGISYIYRDLREKFFSNETFDEIVCLSVLEHVGMDNVMYTGNRKNTQNKPKDYLVVVSEFKRICKRNGKCLITVPFGIHANFGWMQVFDTTMIEKIIRVFHPASYSVSYYRYENGYWDVSSQILSEKSVYRVDYPKNEYCVAAESVACIELRK
jgi:hypothetical protein